MDLKFGKEHHFFVSPNTGPKLFRVKVPSIPRSPLNLHFSLYPGARPAEQSDAQKLFGGWNPGCSNLVMRMRQVCTNNEMVPPLWAREKGGKVSGKTLSELQNEANFCSVWDGNFSASIPSAERVLSLQHRHPTFLHTPDVHSRLEWFEPHRYRSLETVNADLRFGHPTSLPDTFIDPLVFARELEALEGKKNKHLRGEFEVSLGSQCVHHSMISRLPQKGMEVYPVGMGALKRPLIILKRYGKKPPLRLQVPRFQLVMNVGVWPG